MTVHFGIGVSNFAELIKLKATYIDKTLWIKELLEDLSSVILFPRPRRFGKTLNMTMLRCFLDIREIEKNKDLFKNLKISHYPEILKHQGIYPVIFMSLKEVKERNFEDAYQNFAKQIQMLFEQYEELQAHLSPHQQAQFMRILTRTADKTEVKFSLRFLSQLLEKTYQQKVWILIDEYDTPIHAAWEYNYYDEMKNFMQGFLGAALKDNTAVYKSVLTGIMRISKEGMFSDLNNVTCHSMLSNFYGAYFGFTEQEVDWICEEADVSAQREQVREWYNGYKFGDLAIYNPWSIINFAKNKKLEAYWVHTGSSQIIEDLIAKASDEFKSDFEALIQGKSITKSIHEKISFPEIHDRVESAIWSFLLFSGYLKIIRALPDSETDEYDIALPNIEITRVYQNYFLSWLRKSNTRQGEKMLDALISADIPNFDKHFTSYMQETMSYFDFGDEIHPEKFYHALVLGILVYLRPTHQVSSNREAGNGRYDVLIIPKDVLKPGIILEFKVAESEKLMPKEAKLALAQIKSQNYQAELEARGIKKILKIAIVFFGKKVLIKV